MISNAKCHPHFSQYLKHQIVCDGKCCVTSNRNDLESLISFETKKGGLCEEAKYMDTRVYMSSGKKAHSGELENKLLV